MIYELTKKSINLAAAYTPNALIPKFGQWVTSNHVESDWAEIYLVARFVFSVLLAVFIPVHIAFAIAIIVIQTCSIIYLLKIVFPLIDSTLLDPGRSLFFALGHYLEIGLSMSYIYWAWGCFSIEKLSRVDSVYYSFVTMTTLGYGDIHPRSDLTKLLATGQTLLGMFMFAIVIGLFLSLSSNKKITGETVVMPTISMFYGILIRMFFYDAERHNAPHVHADYQGQVALHAIQDGSVLAGALPPKKHKIHQEELLADWQLAVNGKKPFPIRGLDQ